MRGRPHLLNELAALLFQLVMGGAAIYTSLKPGPIYNKNSPFLLPNQKFVRSVFYIVGLVFIVGGIWTFWVGYHVNP